MSKDLAPHAAVALTTIPLGQYRHVKTGNLYEVLGAAFHTETQEEMVIYKALYTSVKFDEKQLWVRPKKMFLEKIEWNGAIVARFELVAAIKDA